MLTKTLSYYLRVSPRLFRMFVCCSTNIFVFLAAKVVEWKAEFLWFVHAYKW